MHTLKRLDFRPSKIVDIGCHRGDWTRSTSQLFPSAHYVLFDAERYGEAEQLSQENGYPYIITVLSDTPKEIDWYSIRGTGDSMFKECTRHYEKITPTPRLTTTLDEHTKRWQFPVDFIKIDCQGAEIPILRGATETLKHVQGILIEMPFVGEFNKGVASFLEHIMFMDSIGFVPLDIEEVHRPHDIPIQIDIVFVRKDSTLLNKVQSIIQSF